MASFDTDINNYSTDELFAILSLTEPEQQTKTNVIETTTQLINKYKNNPDVSIFLKKSKLNYYPKSKPIIGYKIKSCHNQIKPKMIKLRIENNR